MNTITTPHRLLEPEGWAPPRGYANGMVAEGRMVVLGGIIGWNAQQKFEHPDLPGQFAQVLENIATLLAEAGSRPEHLVRLTWYITDRDAYLASQKELGAIYRRVFGRHFPAMAVVQVVSLMEREALIEIEATAIIPPGDGAA